MTQPCSFMFSRFAILEALLLDQRHVVLSCCLSILIPQICSKWKLPTYTDYICHAYLEQDTSIKDCRLGNFINFQLIHRCLNQSEISFFSSFFIGRLATPSTLNGLKQLKKEHLLSTLPKIIWKLNPKQGKADCEHRTINTISTLKTHEHESGRDGLSKKILNRDDIKETSLHDFFVSFDDFEDEFVEDF